MKIHISIPDGVDPKASYARLASWFGCGYICPAPGTWGSLGAIIPALVLHALGGVYALALSAVFITVVGFWAAHEFDKAAGGQDSKSIVIDEVAGMWIALLAADLSLPLIIFAFLAFRFFDILKPWPVSYFDRKHKNAIGVMMDDVVAGLFAYLCVWALSLYL
jgi:phosphatidylglycerophosphatase A